MSRLMKVLVSLLLVVLGGSAAVWVMTRLNHDSRGTPVVGGTSRPSMPIIRRAESIESDVPIDQELATLAERIDQLLEETQP